MRSTSSRKWEGPDCRARSAVRVHTEGAFLGVATAIVVIDLSITGPKFVRAHRTEPTADDRCCVNVGADRRWT